MGIRRIIGNILGILFLVTLATTNLYVSDPSAIETGLRLVYHITELLMLIFPLLTPLALVRKYEVLRKIALTSLSIGTLSFAVRQIQSCLWAFESGELIQKLMFPLLTVVFISILLSQFFELREKMYSAAIKG